MNTKTNYFSLSILTIIFLCLAGLFQSCETKDKKNDTKIQTIISQTEIDIDKAIIGAYEVWFLSKGGKPDFSNFEDYYESTAIFQDIMQDSIIVSPISENVEGFKNAFNAGHIFSFNEREIGSETTYFGNTAHRISYHIYHTNSDSITNRGVNSIQLVYTNGKWKVQSILRQSESDNYQLPKKYDSFK